MTDEAQPVDDLDRAISELYAGSPGDFVAGRQRLVKALRAAKRREEANEVAALGRPTLVAWAANRAAVAPGDRLAALLAAGRDLVEAQTAAITKGDASTLRSARTARQRAVSALVDAAVAAAKGAQAGIDNHRDELTSLFEAASLDAEAAQQLAAGRLVRAPEVASGFGLLGAPDLELAPVTRAEPKRLAGRGGAAARKDAAVAATKPTPKGGAAAEEPPVEAKASAAERRAARAAVAEAQRRADAAEGDRADRRAALGAARDAAAGAAEEVSEREAALADARQRAEEAAAAVAPAEEGLARAEAAADHAAAALEQARGVAAALGE